MTTVSEVYGTVDALIEAKLAVPLDHVGSVQNTIWADEYRAQWLATMTRVANEVLAMPVGLAHLTMNHVALVDAIPENVDEWERPVALKTSDFIVIAGHVRTFWIYAAEIDPTKWDALITLPIKRIDAISYLVDAPGPQHIVGLLDIEQIRSVPSDFIHEMANAFGCHIGSTEIENAIRTTIREWDEGGRVLNGQAMIDQVKKITGIEMLVDP